MRQIFLIILVQLTLKVTSDITQEHLNSLYNAAGGKQEFLQQIIRVSDRASALRGGIGNVFGEIAQGRSSLIARLDFDDGVSWAAKVSQNTFIPDMQYARTSLDVIQRYCPDIPAPRIHGEIETLTNSSLVYYFSDWLEGSELFEKLQFDEFVWNSKRSQDVVNLNVTVPDKLVPQLAQFIYNLTTCPIPEHEVTELASIQKCTGGFPSETNVDGTPAQTWVMERFVFNQDMLLSEAPMPPFHGLDKMLLLSWVSGKFASVADTEPFVLNYWDLRPRNIIVDNEDNLAGIIDWDNVFPVPLKLSAISLEHKFFHGQEISYYKPFLNPKQSKLFREELHRIGLNRSSIIKLSQLLLYSEENRFLDRILLRKSNNLPRLQNYYPELLSEALDRSPKALARASAEWEAFTHRFFTNRGRPVPDWPLYVQIQEGLGIYGTTSIHRLVRGIKRKAQIPLQIVFSKIGLYFPKLKWARRKRCYFAAALCEEYKLPSGDYSC